MEEVGEEGDRMKSKDGEEEEEWEETERGGVRGRWATGGTIEP